MWKRLYYCFFLPILMLPGIASAQPGDTDSTHLSLMQCLHIAIKNQPALRQAGIDEEIAHTNNMIGLSGWLPQIGFAAGYQHYFQLPVTYFPDVTNPTGPEEVISTGVKNTVLPAFNATQTIFSSDVLFAAHAAPLNTLSAKQNIENVKIQLVADVSKAFYNVLLTEQQLVVLKEDTARLGKNLRDAYSQYVAGLVDKVDYKRAAISLNNSTADLKNAYETIKGQYANLQQLMGISPEKKFELNYDTTQMMQETSFDTTEPLHYERRIEFQQLQTQIKLQRETTGYYLASFIPTLSANYSYVPEYLNNNSSDLFNNNFPYSYFGLNLNFPIFQGFKRLLNIRKSKLQEERQHWDEVNLRLAINTQYQQALAGYKSNYNNYIATQQNVQMAKEVYDVVKLQYREGIKQYLEVITAESDLRTSEINYLNALFQLLQSKIDLQRSLGDINTSI